MMFRAPELTEAEQGVVAQIDRLRVRLGHSTGEPRRWFGLLRRTSFAKAIQGSNTIEGINITIDDAIAAVEREVPQDASTETWRAIEGYREAMTYVLSMARQPEYVYSSDILKSLHFMMLNYDLDKAPGQWRPGEIFIRRETDGEIVYTGPSAEQVPKLMTELVNELNAGNAGHPLIAAAMAHLNLTMIHPFKDGNGRMARCLQSLFLARTVGLSPVFSSIEEYLGRNTQDYYRVLEQVGAGSWHPERDARPWIRFCLTAHFRQATTFLRRIERIGAIWDDLESLIAAKRLPERAIFALADATTGLQVRNPLYRKAADISNGLASRDLRALVEAGLLVPVGEKRGRYYVAGEDLKAINRQHPMQKRVPDPFEQQEPSDVQPRLPGI